jgi:HD-GYP domain-containing protein (c-di-GMP phosphodiesterase class II)
MARFAKKTVGKLSILSGPGAGSFYFLSQDRYTLGRGDENPIAVYETSVSRVHCQILRSGGKYFLVDINATNGTFLNGEKLRPNQPYEIEPGSVIHLGNAELFFSIDTIEMESERPVSVPPPAPKKAAAPSKPGGLFDEATYDDETTAEIDTEALSRQKRTSSTLPFNIFSSKNLVAIYRILGAIGAINDREQLMEKSLFLVVEVMRAERGFLFLVDELVEGKGKPAAMKVKSGKSDVSAVDLNSPMIKRVLNEGIALLSSGVPAELGVPAAGELSEGSYVSTICAPLQSRKMIFGVLYIDVPVGVKEFTKEDVELLSAIGIHLGALMENIELSLRNQELFLGVIKTLVYIIEAKDKYTLGHSERVTQICLAVADEMKLAAGEREALRIAGLIHDIGKIVIPEEVLNKPGKLTDEEYKIIKRHPTAGNNFVEHMAGFDEVRNGILYHHERFDGKGYPKAVSGNDIPMIARIIAAADAFDAMTSDRPYRKGFSEEHAIEELVSNKSTQFDPDVIDAFLQAYVSGNVNLERRKTASPLDESQPPDTGR